MTTQNVACPMMIVQKTEVDAERSGEDRRCSARPVMIPGSAIGRMTRNEIVSRAEEAEAGDGERRKRAERRAR